MDAFDLSVVVTRVAETTAAPNWSKETLRDIFEAEILDWTDNYDENLSGDAESELARYARRQIGQLWLHYAQMEANPLYQSQPEDAPDPAEEALPVDRSLQVLDKATQDPFGSQLPEIYFAYIETLGAASSAPAPTPDQQTVPSLATIAKQRDVFLLAVSPGRVAEAAALEAIWVRFLDWTNRVERSTQTLLTLEGLKAAVRGKGDADIKSSKAGTAEVAVGSSGAAVAATAAGPEAGAGADAGRGDMDVTPPSSDDEDEGEGDAGSGPGGRPTGGAPKGTRTSNPSPAHASSSFASSESKAGDDNGGKAEEDEEDDTGGAVYTTITPELLIKRHSKRPTLLFLAPHKEPVATAVSRLLPEDVKVLEGYMGCPLGQVREKSAWLLDLIEGLWMAQALRERAHDQVG